MAKTIKMPKEITPKMREDYLLGLGKAWYGQRTQGKTYGISSPSKQLKGGDSIEKVNQNEGKGNVTETGG